MGPAPSTAVRLTVRCRLHLHDLQLRHGVRFADSIYEDDEEVPCRLLVIAVLIAVLIEVPCRLLMIAAELLRGRRDGTLRRAAPPSSH